ncbi:MAG TPA: protein kinase [Ktedonobacteraceae bacterium]|nr:protein kinase [Ktedonobacteraceae bacterium]
MEHRARRQLGDYRFIRPLGHGSFSEVYLGEHIALKQRVAIKVLRAPLSREDQERFLNEMQTIAHLNHPAILPVREYGVAEGIPFLVMSYLSGGSLRQRHRRGACLPPIALLPYIQQIASALHYAHSEGIVHRNIKPENLLVDLSDTVLLSDFGLTTGQQSSRSQSLQEIANAALYMAPELLQGRPVPASDQYALGIVVYEWLCGRVPFEGSFSEVASKQFFAPPPAMKPLSVSSEVEAVVMRALAKAPEQRFDSVQAFAAAFEQAVLLDQATVRVRPGSSPSLASLDTMRDSRATRAAPFHRPRGFLVTHAPRTHSTSQRSERRQRGLSRFGMLLSIASALLVILGAGSFALFRALPPRPQEVAATATVKAQRDLYTRATSGRPLLSDPLSRNGNPLTWLVSATSTGACTFTGGSYHASTRVSDVPKTCLAGATFSNFTYQAQVTILKGDAGGLLFRVSRAGNRVQAYLFSVDQSGSYALTGLVSTGNQALPLALKTFVHRPSKAIRTGLHQPNLLTVTAQGNRISLYINGQYMAQVRDASSPSGYIGVIAWATSTPTEVAFSKAQVWPA